MVLLWFLAVFEWGRKDGFPGADGSTIQEVNGLNPNAQAITIYDSNSNILSEGVAGIIYINITQSGVLFNNTSLIYTIKHPLSYLNNTSRPYDWYTDNESKQNNDLWDDLNKSSYDPCPRGWKIPHNGTWTDLESSAIYGSNTHLSNGRLYNTIAWYPTCGFRLYDQGQLGRVGMYGYSWSNSVDDTIFAYGLGYSTQSIGPNNTHYRAYGFPIRCIQE